MALDDTPRVVASFELTFDDYNAMHLLSPNNRLTGWKAHALLLVMAFGNIGLSVFFISLERPLFGYEWLSYINAMLGGMLLMMSYILRPLLMRRNYKLAALKANTLSYEADATSMRSSRKGLRSEFDWEELVLWSETDQRFFFWINKIQAVIVPKRALRDDDINLLRRFATDAGVEKK